MKRFEYEVIRMKRGIVVGLSKTEHDQENNPDLIRPRINKAVNMITRITVRMRYFFLSSSMRWVLSRASLSRSFK